MKVFLVFLALLIVCVSFLCLWSDMNQYALIQQSLKEYAEEAASGIALLLDAECYAQGMLCIDSALAEAYIDYLVEYVTKKKYFAPPGIVNASYRIVNDPSETSGEGGSSYNSYPIVQVELTYRGRDLFRLPFICVDEIRRTAVYCWENS